MTRPATRSETDVGKAPRHEIAGEWGRRWCRGLYGDLAAASGWARLDRIACGHRVASRGGCGRLAERELPKQIGSALRRAKIGPCCVRGHSLRRTPHAERSGCGCGGGTVFWLAAGGE